MTPASVGSRQPWSCLWPIAVICALALAFMWRPVLRGEVFLPLDALVHLHPWRYSYERLPVNNPNNLDAIRPTYPRRLLANDMLRQGAWPLWNQSILTGTPLLADSQLAFFYPPRLLFLLLPLPQAFGYYAFVHLIIAGIGAYVFARQLGLGTSAATLTGACYMLNCYMLTWLQLPAHVGATAVLPWCFWSIERACLRTSWPGWALAGMLLALPLLCHTQLSFYLYVGSGGYVLVRLLRARDWPERSRVFLGFTMAMAIALMLSAVQLLPSIALSAQGQRNEIGATFSADYSQLLRLLLPALGGTPRIGAQAGWGPPLLQVPYPFMGLVSLALALLALLFSRDTFSTFFGLMAVLSFSLAVGSPLLYVFTLLVPPYRQFEDHSRWFILWGFAIALLAGMGLEALQRRGERPEPGNSRVLRMNRLLLGAVGLCIAGWSWSELQLFTPQSRYGLYITLIRQQALAYPSIIAVLGGLGLALAWTRRVPRLLSVGLLIALIFVDLAWHGGSYNTSVDPALMRPTTDLVAGLAAYSTPDPSSNSIFPPTRQLAFLQHQQQPFRILGSNQTVLPPNIAGAFGLEDIRAYHSLYAARYNRLARMIDGKDYTRTSEGHISLRVYFTSAYKHRRLLDMLNVTYLLFPPGSQDDALYAPLELVERNDEGSIYRNPQVLPRAWLIHTVEVIADDNAELARMSRPDFDPAAVGILASPAPPVAAAPGPEPTPVVAFGPNQVRIQASAAAPALLVLSDAYSDGWQATVDGQDAPIYRANYAFRGIWLAPGDHTIIFTYRPQAFLIGGGVSAGALLLLAGWGVWHWWSYRRRQ